MANINIVSTEYYNCPYCHRIMPDYAICNCVKIYNQALEDFITEIERQTTFYCGKDSHLRQILEQLKK